MCCGLVAVVPSQIPSILENRCSDKMIRNLLIGGAPLSDKLAEAVKSRGINAWLGYGMTETCSHVALRKVGEESIFTAMPEWNFVPMQEIALSFYQTSIHGAASLPMMSSG